MTCSSLLQSNRFEAALRACGADPVRLDGGVLLVRRRFASLPLGMLARVAPDALPAALMAARDPAHGLRRAPLIVSPTAPLTAHDQGTRTALLPLASPAQNAQLALGAPDMMHKRLHQKWRNRLRRAQNAGLRLQHGPLVAGSDHWVLAADRAQQRRRGYGTWPTHLTEAYAGGDLRHAVMFEAYAGYTPLAAMLFLRHGSSASYHIGHATPAGCAANAHNLLMWHAMVWLADHGHDKVDLGLLDTEGAPGLARFKLGTAAQVENLGGTWLSWPPVTALLHPLARIDRRLMAGHRAAPMLK